MCTACYFLCKKLWENKNIYLNLLVLNKETLGMHMENRGEEE